MGDPGGALLREYLRVVREISPASFLFENVRGLLTVAGGKVFQAFPGELAKGPAGKPLYDVSCHLLDRASFGVPQYRSRVILFGTKGGPVGPPR
jgi:DNA (cytosine-5)-methyltransferase 1